MWMDRIFENNPSMNEVYPDNSRYVLEAFCIDHGEIEFFDLGVKPIVRNVYSLHGSEVKKKGYKISDACIHCGKCERVCPQSCIQDFVIQHQHCLHCGLCFETCPVQAIERM